MIFEHTNYRSFLKSVLAKRVAKNPSYSLRAMASSLEVYPSYLSEVTRGSKNLSQQNALRIAKKLGLKLKETEYFCLLVQYESARSIDLKESIANKLRTLNRKQDVYDIDLDVFSLMSEWYHAVILELCDIKNFEFTPKKIAKTLGISVHEVEDGLDRLIRLGFLVKTAEGSYERKHQSTVIRTKPEHKTEALQKFHKHMLEKAIESLDSQTLTERFIGTETFAIDTEQLEEAKEITEEFFSKMIELFNRSTKKDQVYHLGVQLFKLTKELPKGVLSE